MMKLPLSLSYFHEKLFILDWDPARKALHRVFEIAVKKDFSCSVDDRCAGGMEDIKSAAKWPFFSNSNRKIPITKKHEDIPDPKLSSKGNGIVENSQIPSCAIRRWINAKLILGNY